MREVVVAVLVLVLGCKDKSQPAPANDPVPKPDEASPTSSLPVSCTDYIAAIDRLKACDKVDPGVRDFFVETFAQDQDALSGRRPATPDVLGTLCSARVQNVSSVLAAQCDTVTEKPGAGSARPPTVPSGKSDECLKNPLAKGCS
jgi:hypothetical protein